MKKRKMLATGGIVTTLLLAGSGSAFAQTLTSNNQAATTQKPALHRELKNGNHPRVKNRKELSALSVRANDSRENLRAEREARLALIEQGFSPSHIQKVVRSAKMDNIKKARQSAEF